MALGSGNVLRWLGRVIGTVVYDLPRSEDPTSVLAKELYGAFSTDLMSDEFDGLGSLAVIDGFTRARPAIKIMTAAVSAAVRAESLNLCSRPRMTSWILGVRMTRSKQPGQSP